MRKRIASNDECVLTVTQIVEFIGFLRFNLSEKEPKIRMLKLSDVWQSVVCLQDRLGYKPIVLAFQAQ